jgi:hypothetical protein
MSIMRVLRFSKRIQASTFAGVGIVAILLLSGCSGTSVIVSVTATPGAAGATSTVATSATAAPTSAGNTNPQNCQQIAGFSGAGSIPEGGRLSNVPFPSNAQSTEAVDTVNQPGLYEVTEFNVCAPATTTSALYSFYASKVPNMGWTQSSIYPYDGGYQAACGDPYCWKVGSTPEFSSLEIVAAAANGFVTYRMRLAFPPSLPDCSNILPPGNSPTPLFFWDQQTTVPLPPLTIEGLGDGSSVGGLTVYSQAMCSPGTASSISSYMSTELGKHGWSATSQSLCGTSGWVKNNAGLAIKWTVSNPLDWSLSYCH